MFSHTYKNTLKTLFRSIVFIVIIVLVFLNVLFFMSQTQFGHYNGTRIVGDKEPSFVLIEHIYRKLTFNALHNSVMIYAVPLLCVFSVVIVQKNDFNAGLFEVEKASGAKPSRHLFGRISAIITIDFIVATLASYLSVWWYCGTRGGVEGWSIWQLLSDSGIRVIRIVLICELPAILLCVTLTYMIGALFKSAFASGTVGTTFVITFFALNLFFRSVFQTTFAYKWLNYLWWDPYTTLNYFDTSYANEEIINGQTHVPASWSEITIWVGIMVGFAVVFTAVSYFLTRKRSV